jgi:undecaprenyl diphosphate synthase
MMSYQNEPQGVLQGEVKTNERDYCSCQNLRTMGRPKETSKIKNKVPRHVGFIPDGNRRWAVNRGLTKKDGYAFGVEPGLALYEQCKELSIEEISIYGFTQDNTKRPSEQKKEFQSSCIRFAMEVHQRGAALLVIGDETSAQFPEELLCFRERTQGGMKVNLLVNYGWQWDLAGLKDGAIKSKDVSRLELVVRWGGGRRLSGFLPVQSVYADIYVVDEYWPDFKPFHFNKALEWFSLQDQTLGG